MSAAERSSGPSNRRLGRRERLVLTQIFLIFNGRAGIIHFEDLKDSLLTDTDTWSEYWRRIREAELCRQALYRLEDRGYLRRLRRSDGSTVRCSLFEVTEEGVRAGRSAARETLKEEIVKRAVNNLRLRGVGWATINEIRDEVWRASRAANLFTDRGEFDGYWTKRRLGLTLKRLNLKRTQRHVNGRERWGYILDGTR